MFPAVAAITATAPAHEGPVEKEVTGKNSELLMSNQPYRVAILCVGLLCGLLAGKGMAQSAGGTGTAEVKDHGPQQVLGPGVRQNVVSIEKVMGEIHQLMSHSALTPQQATEVSNMLLRLGFMMQEMSGPQREKLAPQNERELQEIRRKIETLRRQVQ
jgi:hypothetical protein